MTSLDWLNRNFIMVMGKGGVGKTSLADAASRMIASQGRRVLLAHITQAGDEIDQKVEKTAPLRWEITLSSQTCFREYVAMKLKIKSLYTFFLGNKIIQYFEKAAPGVREIVLLGKVWFERHNYDHVVVDMPSTGYALAMINAPFNFARLFPGGPVYQDSLAMAKTLQSSEETAFVTVTLPEEMPLQETLELSEHLKILTPENLPWIVVNRAVQVQEQAQTLFAKGQQQLAEAEKTNPLWQALDFRVLKYHRQRENLQKLEGQSWFEIPELAAENEPARYLHIANLLKQGQAPHG